MDPRNHSFLQIFLNTEYRLFASEPWQTVIANILNALSIYHICMSRAQLLLCGFFFNGLIHFLRDFCFLVFSFQMYSVNECRLNDVELKEIYIKTILKLQKLLNLISKCKQVPAHFFSFFVYFTFPNLKKKQLLLDPSSIAIMP